MYVPVCKMIFACFVDCVLVNFCSTDDANHQVGRKWIRSSERLTFSRGGSRTCCSSRGKLFRPPDAPPGKFIPRTPPHFTSSPIHAVVCVFHRFSVVVHHFPRRRLAYSRSPPRQKVERGTTGARKMARCCACCCRECGA
uniref:Putative secreted protein n=1 Tax=Anopheles marajoara TaxID=58244 RepID=A0A2M4C6M2_9DIPT